MTIVSCEATGHGCRCATTAPLVVDPTELASVGTVPVGPGGEALLPVLFLPGGLRIYVDASSTDIDDARWWHELGVAALLAAMHYDEVGSRPAR